MDDQMNQVEAGPGEAARAQEAGVAGLGRGGQMWRQEECGGAAAVARRGSRNGVA